MILDKVYIPQDTKYTTELSGISSMPPYSILQPHIIQKPAEKVFIGHLITIYSILGEKIASKNFRFTFHTGVIVAEDFTS